MNVYVDAGARRWIRGAVVGGIPALVVHTWLALGPERRLFGRVTNGQFYEVQARSLLDGRWDVPATSIGAERFRVGDRFYEYFGPWPAVTRMPVVAFTDDLDGRLSRMAVLLAMAILVAGVAALLWQVRSVLTDGSPDGPPSVGAVAAFVFVAACGTPILFISSWTAVYHEAIAWGVAWAVVSYALLLAHLRSGRFPALVGAGTTAALSLLSRGSVGLGPVVALTLVGAVRLVQSVRSPSPESRTAHLRALVMTALCTAVPVALNAYVSWARFGTLSGVPPYEKQDLLLDWPPRVPAMAANDGSLFGVHYAPTIVLQYLRPDGFRIDRLFPWFGFAPRPTIVGDAVFEALNPSASLVATSPLFLALAVAGMAVVVRRRVGSTLPAIVGAIVGCGGALSLAFVDQRYQGDFVPAIVVLGAIGWVAATDFFAHTERRTSRALLVGAIAIVAAWSVWANASLAYQYQHGWSLDATTDSRAAMVRAQLAVHDLLSSGAPSRVVESTDDLDVDPHTLAVSPGCRRVAWSDGREWHPVEVTSTTGRFLLDLEGETQRAREDVRVEDDSGTSTIVIDGEEVAYRWRPAAGGPTVSLRSSRAIDGTTLDVHLDRAGVFASRVVIRDARGVLLRADAPVAVGRPELGGSGLRLREPPTPICDRIRRSGSYDLSLVAAPRPAPTP